MVRLLTALTITSAVVSTAGCGAAAPDCTYATVLSISPNAGVADHIAKAPGNQLQLVASTSDQVTSHGSSSHCVEAPLGLIVRPQWTSTDPTHVEISSAQDATNGLVTCLGATSGAITVTATLPQTSGSLSATSIVTCH